jgi:hypothetical protein
VAHRHHAAQVQRELARQRAQVVGAARDVLEGARPAAADVADAAELQRPGREPGLGQRRAHRRQVPQVVLRLPAAAVDDQRHRMGTGSFRKPQLAEGQRVGSVGDAVERRRRGGRRDLLPGDGRGALSPRTRR